MLLALAVVMSAIMLAPEVRIELVPVNDLTFHIAASQRLVQSFTGNDPFLEPWVSLWSGGYPLWRSYQPLPHLVAGLWMTATSHWVSAPAAFAILYYLLMVAVPIATYVGAILFGFEPIAAGLAACLMIGVSEAGEFSRYGMSWGAYAWRGSGLYTQLMSFDLLMPALGLACHALETGQRRITASVLVAATALSHIVFGYVAFLSIVIMAIAANREARARRVVRALSILTLALVLIAWFVIPMLLTSGEVNRSRWDEIWKFDSWGARNVLNELFSGRFLDYGRLPVLSLAFAIGSLIAGFRFKRTLPRQLLILSAVWLVIFFGRTTWGYLVIFLGLPGPFHISRFESAFELFAVLLAAWGLAHMLAAAARSTRWAHLAAWALVGVILMVIFVERLNYLKSNTQWGEENLAALALERNDLNATLADVAAILRERPGRVSAGPAGMWGGQFKIGSAKMYSFLSAAAMDEVSFLYHSFSYPTDLIAERDENDAYQDSLFALRALVAPVSQPVPSFYKRRGTHGRFAVYEVSPDGYFGLVDIGATYGGSIASVINRDWGWMQNPAIRAGAIVALGPPMAGVPPWQMYAPLPPLEPKFKLPRGQIVSESARGDIYIAHLEVLRPCYALLKITYFPGLRATVDGKPAPITRVYPDFCAIAVTPGNRLIEVRYQPGPLKPILLITSLLFAGLIGMGMRRPGYEAFERRVSVRLADFAAPIASDRVVAALALAVLFIVAMRPLFGGHLIDGRDALLYPPRLTEMTRALTDQFPPVWAPDLRAGHGQPLLEFAPPLIFFAALPFYKLGCDLADSLQFGLAMLFAFGTFAMYRIGRRYGGSRVTSVGVAAMWLFAPYVMLDLYVRSAMTEASVLAIAPVALAGLLLALDEPSVVTAVIGAAAFALLMIAQPAIALIFAAVASLLTIFRIICRAAASESCLKSLTTGIAVVGGGLALSAFTWMPTLVESGYV